MLRRPLLAEPRVLLIMMPWGLARHPSLGVATLKSILERDGLACDVSDFNCDFAAAIGVEIYDFLSAGHGGFPGESFFTPYYFGLDVADFARVRLRRQWTKTLRACGNLLGLPQEFPEYEFLNRCEDLAVHGVGRFLARCVEEVVWSRYDIVGFSLMFGQTLSSLCLARWIKEHYPEKTVVFGGPSCNGEMGLEMLRSFSPIDVVAIGEADCTVTPLVRAIRAGSPLQGVPGIAFREQGRVVQTPPAPLLANLDWLPIPDFSDYFARNWGRRGFGERVYFESSRGCWWGEKALCSFCGLNAEGLAFRRKSPERVVEELLALEARYGASRLAATDTILDFSFFKTVLPELARLNNERQEDKRIRLFYEMKANVRKDQLEMIREAGVDEVQPGIESFSDGILERMRKGATGIQQMQFVKWATELGIKIIYGIIYSNPGDRVEDYREMEEQIDFLDHLMPPTYLTPMFLERFSPYWQTPEEYGISEIRACEDYTISFPDDAIDRDKLAFRFDYEHCDLHAKELAEAIASCLARFRRWRDEYTPNTLVYEEIDAEVIILDRRGKQPNRVSLAGLQAKVFLSCDRFTTIPLLAQRLSGVADCEIRACLDLLVQKRWAYQDRKGRYLALPIRRELRVALAETGVTEATCGSRVA